MSDAECWLLINRRQEFKLQTKKDPVGTASCQPGPKGSGGRPRLRPSVIRHRVRMAGIAGPSGFLRSGEPSRTYVLPSCVRAAARGTQISLVV